MRGTDQIVPPSKKQSTRHFVSPRTSTPRLCSQRSSRIIQARPSKYINSTSHSLPARCTGPTFHQLQPNPSTNQEAIPRHLLSPRTSTLRIRSQRDASIIQASPSKFIKSTSRSHSPPDVGVRYSIHSNQTLPPNKKQLQDILYLHGQGRREYSHNEVQALSKQAYPSTSTRHHALTLLLTKGTRIPSIPTKPYHQARINRKTSCIATDKYAENTLTTRWKHYPSKPI
ncbi:hypothetical protein E5676_scaffold328G00310 [Cucumis melo var. makuwa]|nr:hypothetical protein E5676_scaffold328G00310 [Cucumis melo var. makuwa]